MNTPRREVAQEFWSNIVGLGRMARQNYIDECRRGERDMNFAELRELEENLKICEAELERIT